MRTFSLSTIALMAGIALGAFGFFAFSCTQNRSLAEQGGNVATTMQSDGADHRQLWTCSMHPQVILGHAGDCPICHMKLTPMPSANPTAGATGERKILYWWDPMLGSTSIDDKPGKSAMGMDRVPVYADEASAGPDVVVDSTIAQNMGVRTAKVQRGSLNISVRAVGMLEVPEPATRDISLKIGGWIDTLQADTEGMHVEAGQPLFSIYSPDILVAEEELIAAAKSVNALDADSSPDVREQTNAFQNSARQKLRLWDIADADIDQIAKSDHAPRTVIVRSPISGHVVDKAVVAGSAVTAGMKVMRIEDHSHLWLDAEIYADDFSAVSIGQTVEASIEGMPGKTFTGKISFIYPHVDHMARTLMVRIPLDNADESLRPGMYATVRVMSTPVENALLTPRDAVIDTGKEQIAFVDAGKGHFQSRRLTVGRHSDDEIEVLTGLAPGDSVVTSGQFLLDVESNKNAAIARLQSDKKIATPPAPTSMPMPTPMSNSMPMQMQMGPEPTTAPAQDATSISVLHCPMKNADWLQTEDTTHNPYFGVAMPSCGSVTTHLPIPSDPLLKEATLRYLAVADQFSRDQFTAASITALKAAVDHLDPMQAKSLQATTVTLANAPDLAAARVALKSVSADLLLLLQGGQR